MSLVHYRLVENNDYFKSSRRLDNASAHFDNGLLKGGKNNSLGVKYDKVIANDCKACLEGKESNVNVSLDNMETEKRKTNEVSDRLPHYDQDFDFQPAAIKDSLNDMKKDALKVSETNASDNSELSSSDDDDVRIIPDDNSIIKKLLDKTIEKLNNDTNLPVTVNDTNTQQNFNELNTREVSSSMVSNGRHDVSRKSMSRIECKNLKELLYRGVSTEDYEHSDTASIINLEVEESVKSNKKKLYQRTVTQVGSKHQKFCRCSECKGLKRLYRNIGRKRRHWGDDELGPIFKLNYRHFNN